MRGGLLLFCGGYDTVSYKLSLLVRLFTSGRAGSVTDKELESWEIRTEMGKHILDDTKADGTLKSNISSVLANLFAYWLKV